MAKKIRNRIPKKNTNSNLDPVALNINSLLVENVKEANMFAPIKPSATQKTKLVKAENSIPRGKPKSGRPWKTVKQKFSSIKKSTYRLSFEKKMELRSEMKHIKELSKSIKEDRKQQNELKKQRRLENAERRLANERKAEVVQIINNSTKLKRMRKKQLRMVEKRDLTKVTVG